MNVRMFAWATLFFFLSCAIGGFLIGYVGPAEARQLETTYVPEIIEVQQDHAWCYVLVNDQNKMVGDIHTLSCVPKE